MNFLKTALTETMNAGIQIKNYNTNEIIRTIVSYFAALIAIIGVVYGLWQLAMGYWKDSPQDRTAGLVSLIASIAAGGLIYIVVNMILA